MQGRLAKRLLLLYALPLVPGAAHAQVVDNTKSSDDIAPKQKSKERTAASLLADVTIMFGLDDNLFATKNHKTDDTFVLLAPAASYSLGGAASGLTLHGSGEFAFYRHQFRENYNDGTLGFDGRVRLNAGLSAIGGGNFAWKHESRTSPESEAGSEPTRFRRAYGYLGLVGSAKPWSYRLGATIADYDFSDTPSASGVINNADRDRRQFEIGTRIGYSLTKGPELFLQGLWDKRDYRRKIDDFGYRRDSSGFSLSGGTSPKFLEEPGWGSLPGHRKAGLRRHAPA